MNDVQVENNLVNGTVDDFKEQPDFASVCSFIHHFGPELGVYLTFPQLESYFRLDEEVNWKKWETLHVKLLNKLKFRARPEQWAPVLARFILRHSSNMDALLREAANQLQNNMMFENGEMKGAQRLDHVPSCVYYQLDATVRIKLLLILLETQFDRNTAFKEKVNARSTEDLRFKPLGHDVWGRMYWLLKDSEINILLYREDAEQESLKLLCQTTDQLRELSRSLQDICPQDKELSIILSESDMKIPFDGLNSKSVPEKFADQFYSMVRPYLPELERGELPPSPKTPPATPIHPPTIKQDPVKSSLLTSKLESVVALNGTCSPSLSDNDAKPALDQSTVCGEDNQPSYIYVETDIKEEEIHVQTEVVKKIKKRNSKRDCTPPIAKVRRSGRQRKQVEFLKMEPLQTSRARNTPSAKEPTISALKMKKGKSKSSEGKQTDESLAPLKIKLKSSKSKSKSSNNVPEVQLTKLFGDGKKLKKVEKKHQKRKRKKKGVDSYPFTQCSSTDQSEDLDDTFEQALLATECEWVCEKDSKYLDWLDKPESDFDENNNVAADSDCDSLIQGRNCARQLRLQRNSSVLKVELGDCQICHKSSQPEWILLCDRCDLGHHAMCLCPPLFVIPQGDWFCPRCRHAALLSALDTSADMIDADKKEKTVWKRMQERLNYVNISMTNILADNDEDAGDRYGANDERKLRMTASSYVDASEESCDRESLRGTDDQSSDDLSTMGRRRHKQRVLRNRENRKPQRRMRYRDYSSHDEYSSSSSSNSIPCAPRATRRINVKYNVNEAFKIIDEALESDEKYREEKRLRDIKVDNNHGEVNECEAHPDDPESMETESWKRVVPKRPHKHNRMSSSSEESDQVNESKRTADANFQPPTEDSDEDDSDASHSESVSSDQSWLCAARKARAVSRRSKRRPGKPVDRALRRPLPRFEESDDISDNSEVQQVIRRRRCARGVVNYNESNTDDYESSDSNQMRKRTKRNRLQSDDNSENKDEDRSVAERSPRSEVQSRRTHVLSDSEYEPDQASAAENESKSEKSNDHKDDETEEEEDDDEPKNLTIDETSPVTDSRPSSPRLKNTCEIENSSPIFSVVNEVSKTTDLPTQCASDDVKGTSNVGLCTGESNSPDMFE